jgi:hypothetical protein
VHDVLRLGGVVEDVAGGGEERTGELVIELGQGIAVAASHAPDERGVGLGAILGRL